MHLYVVLRRHAKKTPKLFEKVVSFYSRLRSIYQKSKSKKTVMICLCRENFLLGKAIELNSSSVVVEQLLQLKEFFRLRKVHNTKGNWNKYYKD